MKIMSQGTYPFLSSLNTIVCFGRQESHEDPMFTRRDKVLKRWSQQVTVSSAGLPELYDDGFSWRNYGQKEILGEKYPRYVVHFHHINAILAQIFFLQTTT